MARRTTNNDYQKPDDNNLDIRARILDRTIYLMGKEGTTDVSVRAIAREADVNVAAVNYYFTSKEQMFAEMGKRFQEGFQAVMQLLSDPDLSPEKRLRRWATEVMHHLAEYPGVLALMERQMATEPLDPFGKALRATVGQAVEQLRFALREIVGPLEEQQLSFKLTLLISALAGPFPRHGAGSPGFSTSEQRSGFLDLLLEHLRQ